MFLKHQVPGPFRPIELDSLEVGIYQAPSMILMCSQASEPLILPLQGQLSELDGI